MIVVLLLLLAWSLVMIIPLLIKPLIRLVPVLLVVLRLIQLVTLVLVVTGVRANVHHNSVVDRIVGSYLVPGHLFGSVYYAVECWSVGALWHDVLKVDLMALVVHSISPLSAVPEVRAHVFPIVQLSQLFQAVWNVISHGDLDRVVRSQIVLCGD